MRFLIGLHVKPETDFRVRFRNLEFVVRALIDARLGVLPELDDQIDGLREAARFSFDFGSNPKASRSPENTPAPTPQ